MHVNMRMRRVNIDLNALGLPDSSSCFPELDIQSGKLSGRIVGNGQLLHKRKVKNMSSMIGVHVMGLDTLGSKYNILSC